MFFCIFLILKLFVFYVATIIGAHSHEPLPQYKILNVN